jgi:uncharacterized repeat protein (TIGR03806 family)
MNKTYFLVPFLGILLLLCSCKSDDDAEYIPVSPVVFDIAQVPYNTLSEYNFFENVMADQLPVYGVIPYEPITPLFTDYAKKKRFVWMPNGVKAAYVADGNVLDFPIGTVLIKTFYYNNVQPENTTKIIETRLMIRKGSGWEFVNYIWNEDQTEATLDLSGSFVDIEWLEGTQLKSTNYRIPSENECLTCHKLSSVATPLGVKPQHLNKDYAYADGLMNQLDKFVEMSYLNDDVPSSINTVVDWEDTSQTMDLRVRSYLDINCAHCHTTGGHCSYRPMRLAFEDTVDPINLGVCVSPDENIDPALVSIIFPGRPERSVLPFRMNSENESIRMPLIGRSIVHEESIALITQWIDNMSLTCD